MPFPRIALRQDAREPGSRKRGTHARTLYALLVDGEDAASVVVTRDRLGVWEATVNIHGGPVLTLLDSTRRELMTALRLGSELRAALGIAR